MVDILAHLRDKSRKTLGYNAENYYYLRSTGLIPKMSTLYQLELNCIQYYFCEIQFSRKITSFPLIHENENNTTYFLSLGEVRNVGYNASNPSR